MLGSSGHLCSLEQPRTSSLGPGDRNRKKSHTSQLQELALLIPVTLKTGSKKLTKQKEILLHVLHYIQYLQRTIDVVKALLKIYLRSEEGGLGGLGWNPATGPARQRHSTPSSSPCCQNSQLWGACQKPQKKQLTQAELETWPQKSRSSLALDTPKKLVISSDQKEENMGRTTTSPRCPDACDSPKAVLSSQEGNADGEAGAQLMLLDMTKDIDFDDITSSCCTDGAQDDEPDPAFEDESRGEMTYFLSETLFYPSQQVVFYDSSEEVDNDADPWLPVCTPEGSSQESLLALPPPQVPTWSVTGHPDKILGLSPSLFSSPSKLLPEQILEDDTMFLTQGLFEEVLLDSESPPSACVLAAPQEKDSPSRAPEVPPDFYSLCQSSVFLDHCYLSLSDNSKALSSPSSEDTDTDSLWEQEEDTQADPEDSQSSNDEDDDYTWTPSQRASTLPAPGRRARKGPASKGLVKPKESKKAPCPTKVKKKCVNGFIMFCRMNRKPYIRACPGTASTAATRELARLWRVMTQKERRPYCTKARRFSRQHNRIVKQDSSNSENEDWETPKPFYQLLAEKARVSSDLASAPPPHRD
ncbi:basic helix-loop-helix and HMG box domain-containing protein 1 isoform X1 [Heterocephalus glaber]|uniref:Basic helix-loop-helix and HMG box domain-containing protein 1 isoform X1 n=1 Tax=Heterocephalus glaber TaxID=10181 RepID=A0AAX6S0G7_HETGA|nr:basic helix-loop-helix and HMG box domain-containing protein 1 isoform X1 [Heterocephalus glaber]